MNAERKSDESVVPAKSANNDAAEASAESTEERGSAKRNAVQAALPRTQDRIERKSSGLHRVREAARKSKTLKFTALLHHVNEDCLTEAFFNLKKSAAVGIDGVTWHEYEQNLEANIVDLHDRIHRGAYRAKSSRRAWITKPDGRRRPLGIASLEDKIVQKAVLWVLQSAREQDFLGFSYGFRPGRSQHDALDALSVAISFAKFGLKLNAKKTRLIEFGRHAIDNRARRGEGRPETFDFLGFTHKCAKTRKNRRFTIHRHSMAQRMRATLQAIKAKLRKRMHAPPRETGRWLGAVMRGWLNYHAAAEQ